MSLELNEQQRDGYDKMMRGCNAFITGEAGTGKSFLVNKFIADASEKGRNIIVCAPTGVAATNINGSTIHRVFKAPVGPIVESPKFISKNIASADTVIIDEIGMCRIDLFEFVAKQIISLNRVRKSQNKKLVQIIVCGDFFQLPPVITEQDMGALKDFYGDNLGKGFAFQSKLWNVFNFVNIVLTQSMRQSDTKFFKLLNSIRVGNRELIYQFDKLSNHREVEGGIIVCGTNKRANEINMAELDKIESNKREYYAEFNGKVKESDSNAEAILALKVGARVMILVNDAEEKYINGSFGNVEEMHESSISVKLDTGIVVRIERYTWNIYSYVSVNGELKKQVIGTITQFPLKLAYAITIHKSQGQTYDKVNFIPYCWDCGQLYVGLSRVKSLNGLYIDGYIRPEYLVVSNDVINFYNSMN